MAWYDTKQAAVDPDNPAANEQIPFSEWNAMVTYLKDKIINKAVNDAAIANDRVLVYKTATSTFVFETPSTISALNDIPDVVISGVPADNEVLAYNTATSKWINQTAAEAALATTTDIALYLPLAGGTMSGTLDMGNQAIHDLTNIAVHLDADGLKLWDSTGFVNSVKLGNTNYALEALIAPIHMHSQKIVSLLDPTSAQDAATKNYCDTQVATKELVTNFTNDYVLIYKTASGKFEMDEQSAALGLPVVDTTAIIKGSADGTKQVRFEVDGLTSGTTRVLTVPDKDVTLCDTAEALLLSGGTMAGDINLGGNDVHGVETVDAPLSTGKLELSGGISSNDPIIDLYGKDNAGASKGQIVFRVPNAAKSAGLVAGGFIGISDAPKLYVGYGLDMNDKIIYDLKNSAASALSGTQKDIEIDIGGTPYYFTVYPTKA